MLKVRVTAKHIRKGVKGSSQSCPIALSLREAGFSPYVGPEVWASGTAYVLSRRARRFIDAFDGNAAVKPISFLLRLRERR